MFVVEVLSEGDMKSEINKMTVRKTNYHCRGASPRGRGREKATMHKLTRSNTSVIPSKGMAISVCMLQLTIR